MESLRFPRDTAWAMSEGNVEVIREVYEHWARGDFYGGAACFDAELEFARYGSALGALEGEWRGFEEIRAAGDEYLTAWEHVRSTPERIIDLGDDRVLVLDLQTGRGRNSGAAVEHETAWLFTLREGKIVRVEG